MQIKDITVKAEDKNVYLLGALTAEQIKSGANVISSAVAPAGSWNCGEIVSLITAFSSRVVLEPPDSMLSEICWKILFNVSASDAER